MCPGACCVTVPPCARVCRRVAEGAMELVAFLEERGVSQSKGSRLVQKVSAALGRPTATGMTLGEFRRLSEEEYGTIVSNLPENMREEFRECLPYESPGAPETRVIEGRVCVGGRRVCDSIVCALCVCVWRFGLAEDQQPLDDFLIGRGIDAGDAAANVRSLNRVCGLPPESVFTVGAWKHLPYARYRLLRSEYAKTARDISQLLPMPHHEFGKSLAQAR